MAEVARLYYTEDLSQTQIGRMLNISHSTVSRMLKEAREIGMVKIIIHYPLSTVPSLEKKLVDTFGLKEAKVLPTYSDMDEDLIRNVAQLAARTLEKYLQDGITLSISLGMAVAATVRALRPTQAMHLRVARLQGATDNELQEGTDLVQTLAGLYGGDFRIIPSPWILKTPEICKVLLAEPAVRDAIETAEQADIALVGIGSVKAGYSTILRNGLITRQELSELEMNGAVGEICGKYFNARGDVLDADFNHRTMSIDIRHLGQIPVVVGVAAGVEKANAVLAAVKGRLINVLVTDSSVAREMLLQGGVTDIPAIPANGGKSYA